jgi:hypothetical protein
MAVTSGGPLRCTACLTEVGRDDESCPNCGLRHPTQVLARGGLWVVALALAGLWGITLLVVSAAQ